MATPPENGTKEPIKVFLRLRPINKSEENKGSRSAVEVFDKKRIAVDDPREGNWDVEFDGVSREWDKFHLEIQCPYF
jgi:hypothetical protein